MSRVSLTKTLPTLAAAALIVTMKCRCYFLSPMSSPRLLFLPFVTLPLQSRQLSLFSGLLPLLIDRSADAALSQLHMMSVTLSCIASVTRRMMKPGIDFCLSIFTVKTSCDVLRFSMQCSANIASIMVHR